MKKTQKWSAKQRGMQLCGACKKFSESYYCDDCASRRGITNRHNPKSSWDMVDWNLSNNEIAAIMGVTNMTAWRQRQKRTEIKMNTKSITTREARQLLFTIDSPAADSLRRELFKIEPQDAPLPENFYAALHAIIY